MGGVGYVLSWLRAEGVGMTVCRVLGHRRPSPQVVALQRWLADEFEKPPEHDFRRVTCDRCGAWIDEEVV
jgi:hypothetical protein